MPSNQDPVPGVNCTTNLAVRREGFLWVRHARHHQRTQSADSYPLDAIFEIGATMVTHRSYRLCNSHTSENGRVVDGDSCERNAVQQARALPPGIRPRSIALDL